MKEHVLIYGPAVLFPVFVTVCNRLPTVARCHFLKWRQAHNMLLTFYSMWAFLYISRFIYWSDLHKTLCKPRTPDNLITYSWFASKIWEWLDTAFLICANKQVSWLHFNHHMSAASLVALNFIGQRSRNSVFDAAVLLNSFVHTLMYTYYFDPEFFRFMRRTITRLQILQHMSMMLIIAYASLKQDCDTSSRALVAGSFCYTMYLIQFTRFYVNA